MSPFYANYGFHPRTTWPVEMEFLNPASKNNAHWISSIPDLCNSYLKKTSEKMGRCYDKSKKTALTFKVGNLVMLNGKMLGLGGQLKHWMLRCLDRSRL